MTLVNRLIKEAKGKPDFLKIQPNHVRTLAAHAHSLRYDNAYGPTIEQLEEEIRGGRMRMCGIAVRVDS